MKIQIKNYTPIPAVSIIGCAHSFGNERLEILFDKKWEKLKKTVIFFLSEDDNLTVTVPYKSPSVAIPSSVCESQGICRYVVCGTRKGKKIVSRTGFIEVLPSPEKFNCIRNANVKVKGEKSK